MISLFKLSCVFVQGKRQRISKWVFSHTLTDLGLYNCITLHAEWQPVMGTPGKWSILLNIIKREVCYHTDLFKNIFTTYYKLQLICCQLNTNSPLLLHRFHSFQTVHNSMAHFRCYSVSVSSISCYIIWRFICKMCASFRRQ